MKDHPKPTQQATLPAVLMMTVPPSEQEREQDRTQEMGSLLDTAGRTVAATLVQHVKKTAAGTYIGNGKVEELAALVKQTGAKEVAFDVRLSPRQQRNLEEAVGCRVLDYDELILEIFAQNARTSQAIAAVELARLEYDRARLKRLWTHLDRQSVGGASGTGSGFKAGTGEKQIEMDRRQVRKRIQVLKDDLEDISARKDRAVAKRDDCFSICLVGYTNAGKSTLMNALTRAGVLAEDRLFATLDTRTSRLHLDDGHGHALKGRAGNIVLSDTVGFIRNLPHTLIASFHATLAEVREADLLLHVVDASSEVMEGQIAAVDAVLEEIGADAVPTIMVFNKVDRAYSRTLLASFRRRAGPSCAISALTGDGLDQLKDQLRAFVASRSQTITVRFPLTDGALDAFVRSRATVTAERYDEEHALLTINADDRLLGELKAHPALAIV